MIKKSKTARGRSPRFTKEYIMLHDSHVDDYYERINILSFIVRGGGMECLTIPNLEWLANAGFTFIHHGKRSIK